MSESVIDEATLKRVEEEVAKKQAEELTRLSEAKAKEVEARVRAEMTAQAEKEALAKKLTDQEEQLKKMREEQSKALLDLEAKRKAEQESYEKRLVELEATRKGVVQNISPFQDNKVPTGNNYKGVDLTKVEEIEEASRLAWMEKHGIKDPTWGTPLK